TLVCWAIYRVGIRGRFRHETSTPVLTRALSDNLPDAPVMEQRSRAILRTGNLHEPATQLVRRWFARQRVEVPVGPAPLPALESTGGWWQRRQLIRRLRWFWQLATGQTVSRIGPPELWRLQRELDDLLVSRDSGAWRLAPSE